MNKTQKIIVSFIALSLIILPFSVLVAYTGPGEPTGGGNTVTVDVFISTVMGYIWKIFAALAVILFVYAGILFLLAGGSPEKVQQARTAALWGVVGVIVMVSAYSIFAIVQNLTGLG